MKNCYMNIQKFNGNCYRVRSEQPLLDRIQRIANSRTDLEKTLIQMSAKPGSHLNEATLRATERKIGPGQTRLGAPILVPKMVVGRGV